MTTRTMVGRTPSSARDPLVALLTVRTPLAGDVAQALVPAASALVPTFLGFCRLRVCAT